MEILKIFVFDFLGSAPILVGLMALLGLILQKKRPEKIISGTLKTIVGFLIFGGGAGMAVASLASFQTLFSEGFGLKGVTGWNNEFFIKCLRKNAIALA